MAEKGSGAIRVFFATVIVAALALVALGVYYLVGERVPVESPDETVTASEAGLMEEYPNRLVMIDYEYLPAQGSVSGSVLNNNPKPYVKVHVGFAVYDFDSTRVAVVRDTTSEIQPGNLWRFNIAVPSDAEVADVRQIELDGGIKDVTGPQKDPRGLENERVGPEG